MSQSVQTRRAGPESALRADIPAGARESVLPTVVEILEMPVSAGARLLTGRQAAALRRVRSTSVQELPIDDFVRPGELVMTTGIGLGDEERLLTRFVADIARAGAAALAIATGRHVASIPAAAVMEAERLNLPLIELPWELRFSELSEAVLAHIVDQQHAWLRRSDRIHQLFNKIVLSGGDLVQLCHFAEQQLGRPVRIVDRWGESSESGPGGQAAGMPEGWLDRAIELPINAEQKPLGTLFVGSEPGPLTALDTTVAGHASTAAALIMLMERARVEGEARGQSELLVAVLNDRAGWSRELERRAVALGFDPHGPFATLHLIFGTGEPMPEADLTDVARWAIQRGLAARRTNALQAWDGEAVTLLVSLAEDRVPSFVRGLVGDIATLARRQRPDVTVTCGIGRASSSLADVRTGFHEAVTACRLGAAINGPGSITDYGSLGPYPALYAAITEQRTATALDELHERYLGAAARYEAEAGLPLLETLSAYFEERGNVSATARTLRINRQSLLYRLERFAALSGIDLASPVDRFALELAVRCWRMRSGQLDGLAASRNGSS